MLFSEKFRDAVVEQLFENDDGASVHDAIYEAVGKSCTDEQLKAFVRTLPEDLLILAL